MWRSETPRVDIDYQLNFEQYVSTLCRKASQQLTLKAPITTAADNKYCDIFPHFRKKNRLPEKSQEISCLILYF